uniref:Uncharacterized protein n=1 Tax=viral metagenome TaxID=1070528 RepID=A0A6M3J9G1_9ZZZZ
MDVRLSDWRLWADDALVAAGLLSIGIGLAYVVPIWMLWCYGGACLVFAGWVVSRAVK